jgi:hypothetical protein
MCILVEHLVYHLYSIGFEVRLLSPTPNSRYFGLCSLCMNSVQSLYEFSCTFHIFLFKYCDSYILSGRSAWPWVFLVMVFFLFFFFVYKDCWLISHCRFCCQVVVVQILGVYDHPPSILQTNDVYCMNNGVLVQYCQCSCFSCLFSFCKQVRNLLCCIFQTVIFIYQPRRSFES